jgi:hypothetical protein
MRQKDVLAALQARSTSPNTVFHHLEDENVDMARREHLNLYKIARKKYRVFMLRYLEKILFDSYWDVTVVYL